jgi:integrase
MSARRRDNGKWEVRWRQGGRRYSRTFDRKRDAERFDVELRRRLQLGALGLFEQDVTLGEFVEEWWRTHVIPNLAVSTRVSYRHTWSKHVLPKLGGYRVGEVTPKVVARYRAQLLSDGIGELTVRRALAVLQSILTMAVTEELIASNPVAKVKKPVRVVARQVEPWPPATVERLRARLSLGHATLISVLAYAGLRPGEALALAWAEVGERTLRVRRSMSGGSEKRTKTGATRSVRLLAPVGEDLAAWRKVTRQPSGLVFPRPSGAAWGDDDWRNWRHRVFQANADAIGKAKARPYDLRHSFVSLLIAEGRTVIDVAQRAGHSAETCLRYYAHLFAEFDPAHRVSAEQEIRRARAEAGGRSVDAGPDEAAAA